MEQLFDDMTIILKKKKPSKNMNVERRNGNVESIKKQKFTVNKNNLNNKKLDDSTEASSHNNVSLSLSNIIKKARVKQGLSQKQLAQRINEKLAVINDYENGKAITNPKILGKMETHLKVKLRGKNLGANLSSTSSLSS